MIHQTLVTTATNSPLLGEDGRGLMAKDKPYLQAEKKIEQARLTAARLFRQKR